MPPSGPFPRTHKIELTKHALERAKLRGVSKEQILDALKTGAEKAQPGAGSHGGHYKQFTKGSVVVIAEIADNLCYVLTTYHAS